MDNILTINYILLILVIILGAGLAQVWWHYNRNTQIRHPITTVVQMLGITFVIAMLALVLVSILIGESIVLSTYLLQDLVLSFFIAIVIYFLIIKPSNIEIKEQIKRVNSIINHTLNGILVINEAGIIELFNPSASKILGYDPHEVIGRKFTILVPEPHKTEYMEYLRRYIETGVGEVIDSGPIEVIGLREDGTTIPVELLISNMKLDSKRLFLVVFQDIRHRKEVEETIKKAHNLAMEASSAKSEFISNMSHEIRTPMNTIIGVSDLLNETPLNNEQKQYVDMFKRSSEHLLSLINDILDISKIESGHLELEHIDFDICKLCDEFMDIMQVRAKKKNLELKYTTQLNCPTYLIGDPHRLNQILINLVGNAIKFTQRGGIAISIEPTKGIADNNKMELLFKISDTGIGIPPERTNKIFQNFSQVDSSTTRQYGGTGLGLSISKKLVELMGGKIWVESKVDKGSTFCFTAVFGISEQNYQPPLPEIKKAHLDKNLSILLVDDSEDNREIIKLYLRDQPVKIETAENGIEAIDRIKINTYDVILMDLQMPIMDGYTATIAIREWEKANNKEKTPIVALSANAFREHQQRAFEAGCDNYIVKPVKKGKLIEILASI